MTNLNQVIFGVNKYCGPSVLSILTGKNTDECASAIMAVSGQKVVRGAQVPHILKAVDRLGFDHIRKPLIARSLYGCLCALANFDGFYLIVVPEHIVAVEVKDKEIYFCDNHTEKPIKAEASARLTQEVIDIYYIKERPKPEGPNQQEMMNAQVRSLEDQIRSINRQIIDLTVKKRNLEEAMHNLRLAGAQ